MDNRAAKATRSQKYALLWKMPASSSSPRMAAAPASAWRNGVKIVSRSPGKKGGRPRSEDPFERYFTNLNFDAAHKLMFSEGLLPTYEECGHWSKQVWDEWFPPPNWTRGKPPKGQPDALRRLDQIISHEKLRDQTELDKALIPDAERAMRVAKTIQSCPYYSVRYLIPKCAIEAKIKFEDQRAILNIMMETMEGLTNARDFISKSLPLKIPPYKKPYYAAGMSFMPSEFEYEIIENFDSHVDNIRRIPSIIDSLNFYIEYLAALSPEKHPINWRGLFIEEIGHLWVMISTSRPSSSNDDFIDFVSGALRALGDTRKATAGEVRTVVTRVEGVKGKGGRPIWNRFDGVSRWRRDD